jgi:hypothetical protein
MIDWIRWLDVSTLLVYVTIGLFVLWFACLGISTVVQSRREGRRRKEENRRVHEALERALREDDDEPVERPPV